MIPIHPTAKKILKKYKGQLPKAISNQKTNDYLKELGKKLECLSATTSKTFTKGSVKIIQNYSKWELLSTHTARRSFATNEYLAGTSTRTIMAITGYKTEKHFFTIYQTHSKRTRQTNAAALAIKAQNADCIIL